jgi:hypothetical protein
MVAPPVSRFELADVRSVALFTDRWVCVVDAADPRTELSLEELAAMPWVARPDEDGSGLPAVPAGDRLMTGHDQVGPWALQAHRAATPGENRAGDTTADTAGDNTRFGRDQGVH